MVGDDTIRYEYTVWGIVMYTVGDCNIREEIGFIICHSKPVSSRRGFSLAVIAVARSFVRGQSPRQYVRRLLQSI